MTILRPVGVVLSLLVASAAFAAGTKGPSPAVQRILKAKANGETISAADWHEAVADHDHRRHEARRALEPARLSKDGGSSNLDATVIDSQNYVDSGNTTGKGNNALLPSCLSGGADTAEDAWYVLTVAENITLTTWTTCESVGPPSHDTRLGIFDDTLTLLTCNDDDPNCGAPYYQSRISDYVLGPGTYYIVVDGYGGNEGPYELNVQYTLDGPPCIGSNSSNPTVINSLPYVDTDDTTDDCDDGLFTCELGGSDSGPDHWYEITLNTDVYMDVTVTCDGADVDTRLSILNSFQTEVACNDDIPACATGQSEILDAQLSAGTYQIVVESADLAGGTYTVSVDTTHAPPPAVVDLLPDIIVRESDLYDNDISTNVVPGRTHLRLSNGTANIGAGKLHLFGGQDNGDGTQDVIQRVHRDDGSWYDRVAGKFIFHSGHNHIHFEDWGDYRLRFIEPGDGVGDIVAQGLKTSFCIIDLSVYDNTLPGFIPGGEFNTCGSTIQGLSVGWVDIYSKGLAGQNIDVTDVADGEYWLESVVDPNDNVLESDETNNYARIKVTLGTPFAINPDPYEPNDSRAQVDPRPVGGPNSPNVGPVGPLTVMNDLTLHLNGNLDYFRFVMPADGAMGDQVRIDFTHSEGDLRLGLENESGVEILSSDGTTDMEIISLDGLAKGWYTARISGVGGSISSDYDLTLDPSTNGTPTVTVIDPPAGDVMVAHGTQTYTTTWNHSDPEGNTTWVNIWANQVPLLDGNEVFLPTSQNQPADQGLYIINTSYLLPDETYYVYVEITDGGTKSGSWSPGTITLFEATNTPDLPDPYTSKFLPNYPNPFNPQTVLRLQLQRPEQVSWKIYDARGVLVTTVADGLLSAGLQERIWQGKDNAGRQVSSGVYYSVARGQTFTDQQKLVLLK